MKPHDIAVIAGDGIGPEVIAESLKVLEKIRPYLKISIQLKNFDLGAARYLRTGETLPETTFQELTNFDAILLGAVGDPQVPPGILEREILLKLRFDLDLYINLRPCILLDGVFTPIKHKTARDINFTVVRENTESVYVGLGGVFKKGTADEVAIQEDVNTRKGVERAIRYAFEYCQKYGAQKKLTLVDKANVLTHAHQLWRRTFEEVSREYPGIQKNALYVDAAAMDFIRRPETFDVLVTNNIFGDILTDLGAIISGGLGLAASANMNPAARAKSISSGVKRCAAMFEPIHGSAPDIAGKGLANPLAAILAIKMLLEFLDETAAAKKIDEAVRAVLTSEKIFKSESADLQLKTTEVGELVVKKII